MPQLPDYTRQEQLDNAKRQALRVFTDVWFAELFDLALSGHNDAAITLLGFCARPELQTPHFSEATIVDYWQAWEAVEKLLPNAGATAPNAAVG